MMHHKIYTVTVFVLCLTATIYAADISGTWTAKFDSQVGEQNYTYTFKVNGGQLTGRAKGGVAEADTEITEGKVQDDTISFVENVNFQGMPLKITYSGKVVSDNEIKFTRNVADLVTEEITARRAE
jgi:hypothetical protein